jgi:hypothetical protein
MDSAEDVLRAQRTAKRLPPALTQLLVERAIDKVSTFQFARSARLTPPLQTLRKTSHRYPLEGVFLPPRPPVVAQDLA